MAPERDGKDVMSPEDAVTRMASVTENTRGLRTRTEGLTLAIWALCIAASYLTIIVPLLFGGRPQFNGGFDRANFTGNETGNFTARPAHFRFFGSPIAPLVWYLVAVVMTVGVWRSASLSFQHSLTTPRLVMIMVGWLAVLAVTTAAIVYVQGGDPRPEHIVLWGLVFGLFAVFNPMRFTKTGRWASGIAAIVILVVGVFALFAHWDPRDLSLLTGLGLGAPLLCAGLWLMFTG